MLRRPYGRSRASAVVLVHVSLISGFTLRESDTVGPYFARAEAGVYPVLPHLGYLLYRPFVAARLDGTSGPGIRSYARRRALRSSGVLGGADPSWWWCSTRDVATTSCPCPTWSCTTGSLQIYFTSTVVGGCSRHGACALRCRSTSFSRCVALLMGRLRSARESLERAVTVELVGLAVLYAGGLLARGWSCAASLPQRRRRPPPRLVADERRPCRARYGARRRARMDATARIADPPRRRRRRGAQRVIWALAGVSYWAVSTRVHLTLTVAPTARGNGCCGSSSTAPPRSSSSFPAVIGAAGQRAHQGASCARGRWWRSGSSPTACTCGTRASSTSGCEPPTSPVRGSFVPMFVVAVVGTGSGGGAVLRPGRTTSAGSEMSKGSADVLDAVLRPRRRLPRAQDPAA